MIVHTYTVKVPLTHQGPTVWTEELIVAMGKPKDAQRFLGGDAQLPD